MTPSILTYLILSDTYPPPGWQVNNIFNFLFSINNFYYKTFNHMFGVIDIHTIQMSRDKFTFKIGFHLKQLLTVFIKIVYLHLSIFVAKISCCCYATIMGWCSTELKCKFKMCWGSLRRSNGVQILQLLILVILSQHNEDINMFSLPSTNMLSQPQENLEMGSQQ